MQGTRDAAAAGIGDGSASATVRELIRGESKHIIFGECAVLREGRGKLRFGVKITDDFATFLAEHAHEHVRISFAAFASKPGLLFLRVGFGEIGPVAVPASSCAVGSDGGLEYYKTGSELYISMNLGAGAKTLQNRISAFTGCRNFARISVDGKLGVLIIDYERRYDPAYL
jgi:hypothetical protein